MASDGEETVFRCKKCKLMFTEAEKDMHRETHRTEMATKYKPGPKSRTRSAARSDDTATIFEAVSSEAVGKRTRQATKGGDEPPAKRGVEPPAKRGVEPPAKRGVEPPAKRKSKKQYNGAVVDAWKKAIGS